MNAIYGYKCFNKGLTNLYGEKFQVGKIYHADGDIKFGTNGNGFHMCTNLEDTLRYFDAEDNLDICFVMGFGKIDKCDDEYNGYYDMYATEYLIINHILSRKDVISYALNLSEERVIRFISLFKLNNQEIMVFKEKYKYNIRVLNTISYYQEKDYEIYSRSLKKREIL